MAGRLRDVPAPRETESSHAKARSLSVLESVEPGRK